MPIVGSEQTDLYKEGAPYNRRGVAEPKSIQHDLDARAVADVECELGVAVLVLPQRLPYEEGRIHEEGAILGRRSLMPPS